MVAVPSHVAGRLDGRAAQRLDDFLDIAGRVDLDHVQEEHEHSPGLASELQKERAQVTALLARMSDGEGRAIIEWLLDISLRRPAFMPLQRMENIALFAAYREGQNAMVWQIVQAIAEGRSEALPNREGQQ